MMYYASLLSQVFTIWAYGAEGVLPDSIFYNPSFLGWLDNFFGLISGKSEGAEPNTSLRAEIGRRGKKCKWQVVLLLVYVLGGVGAYLFCRYRESKAMKEIINISDKE